MKRGWKGDGKEMEWDGTGWDERRMGRRWNGMGRDGTGWDGMGKEEIPQS